MKDELDRILQEAQFGRVDELAQKLYQIKAKWIKFLRINKVLWDCRKEWLMPTSFY